MASDIDPTFSFDAGGGFDGPVQAPWEYAGALKQAYANASGSQLSSIDQKIKDRLAGNGRVSYQRARLGEATYFKKSPSPQ